MEAGNLGCRIAVCLWIGRFAVGDGTKSVCLFGWSSCILLKLYKPRIQIRLRILGHQSKSFQYSSRNRLLLSSSFEHFSVQFYGQLIIPLRNYAIACSKNRLDFASFCGNDCRGIHQLRCKHLPRTGILYINLQ